MTRERRPRAARSEIDPEAAKWARADPSGAFHYFQSAEALAVLWTTLRDEVIAEHVAEYPGTRPIRWWTYDAPEPRRRIGGIGEQMGGLHVFDRGVPVSGWVTEDTLATYRRLGTPLGLLAINTSDPPTFESEAAYLDRLGLLLPGEKRRLVVADDFEPEAVLP
jgi:hypothetical protein